MTTSVAHRNVTVPGDFNLAPPYYEYAILICKECYEMLSDEIDGEIAAAYYEKEAMEKNEK